eukprot:scaffold97333_cov45-Attheya_sp.AAC.2
MVMKYESLWGKTVVLDVNPADAPAKEALVDGTAFFLDPCDHGWFRSVNDKAWLHYRKFLPSKRPTGVCIWHHGIHAHCGLGFEVAGKRTNEALLAEMLVEAGFAIYLMDMAGHGLSEGKRFYNPSWRNSRDDLDEFARFAVSDVASAFDIANHDEVPLFLMGQSYGGSLVIQLARKWQDAAGDVGAKPPPASFRGICLASPAIYSELPPAPVVFALRRIASVAPKWKPFFLPNPVSPDRIWKSPEVCQLMMADPINGSGKPFRLGTAVAIVDSMEISRTYSIPGFQIPFMVCHGTLDHGVPLKGTVYLDEKSATKDKVVRIVEGAFHDLLGEPDAPETVQAMIDFMTSHAEQPSPLEAIAAAAAASKARNGSSKKSLTGANSFFGARF